LIFNGALSTWVIRDTVRAYFDPVQPPHVLFDEPFPLSSIEAAVFPTGQCVAAAVMGVGALSFNFLVEPRGTVHLTYPSPLVFPSISGHTCIAGQVRTANTAGIDVLVNGFVN
jgi:hypothetical protein